MNYNAFAKGDCSRFKEWEELAEKMPLPIVLYGAEDCDDTLRTRDYLQRLKVPFQEISIDQDSEAERFVIFINGGFRSTPTLVLGERKRKVVLTEPSARELVKTLKELGYLPASKHL